VRGCGKNVLSDISVLYKDHIIFESTLISVESIEAAKQQRLANNGKRDFN
jgi:hypothetical protein